MNSAKAIFNIRDLENISGIKAHTIRIWEKRYGILQPERTDNNIRFYNTESLRKLLNITLLHNHGYKISKIATFDEARITQMVREIISPKTVKHHAVNAFKLAMMQFDQKHFLAAYEELLSQKTFSEIFNEVFIPLLNDIGLLWQTNTVTVAQEHFLTSLLRLKLIANIEKAHMKPAHNDRTFVFYLPANESYDLGLLYLYYEAIQHGYKTVYLGSGIDVADLRRLGLDNGNVVFVTYFTLEPDKSALQDYFSEFRRKISDGNSSSLWAAGCKVLDLPDQAMPIVVLRSFADFINRL